MKSAEEHKERLSILKKHMGENFYKTGQYHNAISDAMEECAASQREQPPAVEMPTDKDLENWVMDGYQMTEKNIERIKAAKCVRDRISKMLSTTPAVSDSGEAAGEKKTVTDCCKAPAEYYQEMDEIICSHCLQEKPVMVSVKEAEEWKEPTAHELRNAASIWCDNTGYHDADRTSFAAGAKSMFPKLAALQAFNATLKGEVEQWKNQCRDLAEERDQYEREVEKLKEENRFLKDETKFESLRASQREQKLQSKVADLEKQLSEAKEATPTHFYVANNSQAFEGWLKSKGIEFIPSGHFTAIPLKGNDIFSLGMQFEKYRSENQK